MRGFLWLQCLMRLTLFLRFNSSTDTKEEAPGSAEPGFGSSRGSRRDGERWSIPGALDLAALPVTSWDEPGTSTSRGGDTQCW